MSLWWLRRSGNLIGRWVSEQPTFALAVELIDHLMLVNGLGITERANHLNLGRSVLVFFSVMPLFLVYVVGCINYYVVEIMPYEGIASLGSVTTVLASIVGQMAINKMIFFIIKRREISRVVRRALDLGPVPLPGWAWRSITISTCILYSIIIYTLCMPLLADQKRLPEERTLIPGLENKLESPSYELTYIINAISLLNLSLIPTFYGLFISLAGHIAGHYIQLCSDFENLLEVDRPYHQHLGPYGNTLRIDKDKLKAKLSKLIEHHCKVIELVKDVRDLFNGICGHDFGLATLGLGILLVSVNSIGVKFLLHFFIYIIGTLYLYCVTGETLRTASEALVVSVWFSGCEHLDPDSRRSLLLVLVSAQKPIALTAGTFVSITYETLKMVIKSCFSIYATFDAAKSN